MRIAQALELISCYDSTRNPLTSLGDVLDPELVSRCLAESGSVTLRKRRLPLEMMVWCIIGMALEREEPLHQIVNRLDIMLPGNRPFVAPSAVILTVLKNEEAAHTKKRARGWVLDFGDADGESDPEWSESRQDREDDEASFRALWVFEEQEKERMALLLNIDRDLLTERIFYFLWTETGSDDDLIAAWNNKRWEHGDEADDHDMSCSGDSLWEEEMQNKLPKDWEPYLRPGETRWMIERNAVAAGFTGYFHAELNYLKWRAEQEADEQAG